MDDFQEVLLFCFVVLFLVGSEGGAEVNSTTFSMSVNLLASERNPSSQSCDLLVAFFHFLEIAHKSPLNNINTAQEQEPDPNKWVFPESHHIIIYIAAKS